MSVNDEKEYPFLKEEKRLSGSLSGRETDTWHLSRCPAYRFSVGAAVYTSIQETGWCQIQCEPVQDNVFPAFPDRFLRSSSMGNL